MQTTVIGSYPKLSSDPAQPNLRQALNDLERGRCGPLEREAMREAGERAEATGLELALQVARQLRGAVAGVYVVPSFGRYERAAQLVAALLAESGERPA